MSEPLATIRYQPGQVDEVLEFLKRTRSELRMLRRVRIWTDRIQVLDPRGQSRDGERSGRVLFGPTCDSVDRLPGELALPADIEEGDFVIFHGAGAYSTVTNTRFNGFGAMSHATVMALE